MSLEYITKVLTVNVNPTQKLILIVLANYSNEFGESYPSHRRLTQLTGLSLSAIKDNLKKLRTQGLVDWQNRKNDKDEYTSNLYKIQVGLEKTYCGSGDGYNTKTNTKEIFILDLDKINDIFKEECDKSFYQHSANSFKAQPRYKELRELARKGIVSPKTGEKINLNSNEFWVKYFKIANSEGHRKWIRSYWDKKPSLMTMLGINQFEAIIERRYG
jgi:DNA-binding transcriptional MocR family regulator|tara:strand:+ start:201 stop:848 length:648 start_codon:yes stop_codon:yes gene_type:complete